MSLLVASALASAEAFGQSSTDAAVPTWTVAVETYADGRHAEAVALAGRIDADVLATRAREELERWRSAPAPEASVRLKASAAMAFELALAHLDASAPGLTERYLSLGSDAVRALERSSAPSPAFTAHWRLASLHYLLLTRQHGELQRQARRDESAELPPALQAEWHMARGVAHETSARLAPAGSIPRVQQTTFGTLPFDRGLYMQRERQTALGHYRAAVEADGGHAEARLRLGRVLAESGETAEARTHLEQVATERCSEPVCGLAWLFLGDWHAAHGTPADTRRAYLRASRVLEIRQSALIGLLRVTLREQPRAALEITRQFDAGAMLDRQPFPDAWSRYLAGTPFGLTAVVDALRNEVRQ